MNVIKEIKYTKLNQQLCTKCTVVCFDVELQTMGFFLEFIFFQVSLTNFQLTNSKASMSKINF